MSGDEGRAAIAETHVSVLVFVGDRAYKLKKPVAMGLQDFSTREAGGGLPARGGTEPQVSVWPA